MFDTYEQTSEFALIATIAETIRRELGDEVEACPGCWSPEQAEPLNRVYRALARRFLETVVSPRHDLSGLVSWVLRKLVLRRLAVGGLDELRIKVLLELEPGTPDDWLGFLLLVPWAEIRFWLTAADQDPE
jgi:hypothetical protein